MLPAQYDDDDDDCYILDSTNLTLEREKKKRKIPKAIRRVFHLKEE